MIIYISETEFEFWSAWICAPSTHMETLRQMVFVLLAFLQLEINLFSFVFFILYFFFLAVTLLDSRSVQGELGWIASPLEGGVSSEALSGQEGEKG